MSVITPEHVRQRGNDFADGAAGRDKSKQKRTASSTWFMREADNLPSGCPENRVGSSDRI